VKMGWTTPFYPVHSPDLAPPDYHLFGLVKVALRGRHFAHKLIQSFCVMLQHQGREFYNVGVQHLSQCWQTCG
jgi:hypothetical protein